MSNEAICGVEASKSDCPTIPFQIHPISRIKEKAARTSDQNTKVKT
jgi:hypothetical protein